MKNKLLIFLIFALCLVSYSQTQLAVRIINSSGVAVTGLTDANIKFRISPFGAGDVLTIPVTEKGTQGNYICTGFTTFQLVKLFIDGVEQEWFGQQYSGDPGSTFVDQTTAESIDGVKTFIGVVNFDSNIDVDGQATFDEPYIENTATVPTDDMLVWKSWVLANALSSTAFDSSFIIRDNRLIVDSKLAADIAGYQYNDIGTAITYASTQSPGSNSRWTIYILPKENSNGYFGSGYAEDITLPDYVNLVGLGEVLINGYITRSGSAALSSKIENLIFSVLDANQLPARLKAYNCTFQCQVDVNDGGTVTLTSSWFKNCGFFARYDDVGDEVVSAGNNVIINCFGNFNVDFQSSDVIMSYEYRHDDGFIYQY